MPSSESHSFHNCALRSSSLIIVNSEKQTIVTATDEVFTTLGYEPHQLIDKSVEILGLKQEKNHYMLQHESFGQMIPFDICIHHDPMSNAVDLDYWLIRPVTKMSKTNILKDNKPTVPASILRISTFGTIEQAYTCSEFPQNTEELQGRPIMSFVHESDVRFLCEKLCKVRHRKRYYMFEIRWLCKGRDYDKDENYIWVEFTVINSPRRRSCSSAYEHQTRPICIIRPKRNHSGTTPMHTLLLPNFLLRFAEQSRIVDYFVELCSVLHLAIDQGATYLIEFISHLLTYTMDAINEFMYYMSGIPQEEKATKSIKKQCYRAVKVSLDDSIWLVPLTQKLEQWTRFNRDASLCKSKKN